MVSFSTNHNPGAHKAWRNTVTYMVSMVTGFSTDLVITQKLQTGVLYQPPKPTEFINKTVLPELSSIFFGSEDTGLTTRTYVEGGQFSLIFNNAKGNSSISITPLHFG